MEFFGTIGGVFVSVQYSGNQQIELPGTCGYHGIFVIYDSKVKHTLPGRLGFIFHYMYGKYTAMVFMGEIAEPPGTSCTLLGSQMSCSSDPKKIARK